MPLRCIRAISMSEPVFSGRHADACHRYHGAFTIRACYAILRCCCYYLIAFAALWLLMRQPAFAAADDYCRYAILPRVTRAVLVADAQRLPQPCAAHAPFTRSSPTLAGRSTRGGAARYSAPRCRAESIWRSRDDIINDQSEHV